METIAKKKFRNYRQRHQVRVIHNAINTYKKSTYGDSQSHKMLTRKIIMLVPKDASHKSQQWNRTR